MNKIDIKNRLNELKDCEYITITTNDGFIHNVDYRTIINDVKNERLIIDLDNKSYAYCRVLSIQCNS